MKGIDNTPLGWAINLLFLLALACTILADFIDQQLRIHFVSKEGFVREKKKAINDYNDCIKKCLSYLEQADEKMQIFDPDGSTFKAVHEHGKMYTNSVAHAKRILQFLMLLLDRSHCEGGEQRALKRLRSMPENGIFPEEFISRFSMKYEVIPEPGDRIYNENHGNGKLDFHIGKENWQCVFDNGEKVILNEKQFKLL